MRTQAFTPEATGLLAGIRVVDMSRLVAGNMTTRILADYGVDVIRVERPGQGDAAAFRQISRPSEMTFHLDVADTIVTPDPVVGGGRRLVDDRPGLGVEVDWDKLRHYANRPFQ